MVRGGAESNRRRKCEFQKLRWCAVIKYYSSILIQRLHKQPSTANLNKSTEMKHQKKKEKSLQIFQFIFHADR